MAELMGAAHALTYLLILLRMPRGSTWRSPQ